MLQNLKQHGIRLHLLSGDRQAAVAQVAQELGLDAYRAEATPEDKLAYVENLQKQGRKVMMIGDGINDAPSLPKPMCRLPWPRVLMWREMVRMWFCSMMI